MLMPVSVLGLRLDYIICRHSGCFAGRLLWEDYGETVVLGIVKNQYQMHSAG